MLPTCGMLTLSQPRGIVDPLHAWTDGHQHVASELASRSTVEETEPLEASECRGPTATKA